MEVQKMAKLYEMSGCAGALDGIAPIIMIVIMFVALYFLMIRPQKKKEETQWKKE